MVGTVYSTVAEDAETLFFTAAFPAPYRYVVSIAVSFIQPVRIESAVASCTKGMDVKIINENKYNEQDQLAVSCD